MSDLVTYDPKSAAEAMQEKIRQEFLNHIPPEAWKQLIEGEIAKFTKPGRDYNNRDTPSGLATVINEVLRKKAAETLVEYLNGDEWRSQWNANGKSVFSDAVKQIAADAAPAIVTSLMNGIVYNVIQKFESEARGNR